MVAHKCERIPAKTPCGTATGLVRKILRTSPPHSTKGASTPARVFPLPNTERKHPSKSSRLRATRSFQAKRERATWPRDKLQPRSLSLSFQPLVGAPGRGSWAAPVLHPLWQISRQKPLNPWPHLLAPRTQAGARPCGERSSSATGAQRPAEELGMGAIPARTGRAVREGMPGRSGESHRPRGAWWSSRNPAALQPPAEKQTKGREASSGDDRPLSLGKVTLQLPSLALRVPAPRPGRPGAPNRGAALPAGADRAQGSLRPPDRPCAPQLHTHAFLQVGCLRYPDLEMEAVGAGSEYISLQVIMVETLSRLSEKRNRGRKTLWMQSLPLKRTLQHG